MPINLIIQTTVPLFSLIALGYLSRTRNILREDDERVFASYLYYIGLPALLVIDLSEIVFNLETLEYMLLNLIPLFVVFVFVLILGFITKMKRNLIFLYIIVTSFGNLGFFGIAFVRFAFESLEAERLAALSVSSINTLGFIITLVLLEITGSKENREDLLYKMVSSLSTNPLILSIVLGVALSIFRVQIPGPISSSLHMIGSSVAPIAIFMLGVSIYGKEYTNLGEAVVISSIRLVFLPLAAFYVSKIFQFSLLEASILVIMYGTPLALSMIILSQRYGFLEKRVTSIILVSSLLAGLTMNLWLLLIEIFL
jgi:predicted permease